MHVIPRRRLRGALLFGVIACAVGMGAASADQPIPFDVKGRSDSTPWVAAHGAYVVVVWGASTDGKADVFAALSRDGGRTFAAPVRVNAVRGEARLGGELPPRVALVPRDGSAVPDISVLWTARGARTEIKAARSRDGGRTFDAPTTLSSGAAGDRGWPALALDTAGTAHAIWLDHRGLAPASGASPAGHHGGAPHDGVAMAQKSGLYYAALSSARSGERELTPGVCYCCKTALAAGPDGALYAAWRHVYPGNLRDIAFAVSRDGGRSFSSPVRVSEDEWAINGCPDDGPAIAVDARGTVHVVWPTVINAAKPQGALFYASTRDGRTFTSRTRVPTLGSPKPSHPQIVLNRKGRIVIAWDELIDGQRVALARALDVRSGSPVGFGEVVRLALQGAAMYPVLAATQDALIGVWTTGGDPSVVRARTIRVP